MRNEYIIDTLTSFDFFQKFLSGGEVLDVYEGFVCQNLDFNPYTGFVRKMTAKGKKQRKDSLQILA